jgi:hypothetical protein
MATRRKTPAAAIAQGLAAGVIGNAVFTGYQTLQARLRSSDSNGSDESAPDDWSEAPAPAQVGQRIVSGVFERDVSTDQAGLLTNVMHWLYGTSWGALYGVLQETNHRPVANGVVLAGAVMGADYTLLPAMRVYKPPWEYEPTTLGKDVANHVVYGLAVAGAYRALDTVAARR